MKYILFLFCGFALSCLNGTAKKQFPSFTYHQIDTIGSNLGQTSLADMDNDGDLDWIVGEAPWAESRLWWWEYQTPEKWIRHDIGQASSGVGGDCYDIDGDGWMDFWGGEVLFLNQKDGTFTRHEVETISSHDSQLGDVNGDNRIDGIANTDRYGLVWYEIPDDPTNLWKEHLIQPNTNHKIHGGVSPMPFGDIDGDNDNDIVSGQAWYENIHGNGIEWEEHKNIDFGEDHIYGIAVKTWVVDMDHDGDIDFVQSEADLPDARVAWFENDGKGNWTRHMIKDKGSGQDFHSLIVADFDNDGDWDVCSGGGPLSTQSHKMYIWENTARKGKNPKSDKWEEHIIAEMPCHEAVGGDVDGDGDIDICSKPWNTGNVHFYLENKLIR